jgi:hypothetical protein
MICDGCKKEVYRARCIIEKGEWLCKYCDPGQEKTVIVSGAMFPFTTTNIGTDPSQPITVQSLRHLRQLENSHNVQSIAFNYDSKHFDCPPRGR